MADILIRGFEMPHNCFECPLFSNCDACEGHECGCGLLGGIGYEEDISKDRRRDDCPIIELPPHGDLIDRDATVRDLAHDYAYAAASMVEKQSVIVPANKEGTK